MKRHELEHVLRASAGITGADKFVVIGSQAIHAQFTNVPDELLTSNEADIFSLRDRADADLIEGSIGEGSPFEKTFGYFAHGVGEETTILPVGWQERLIPFRSENTGGATGLCLEVHDLAVSKLVAGRPKDLEFIGGLFKHKLANPDTVRQRLTQTPLDDARRELCLGRIQRLFT